MAQSEDPVSEAERIDFLRSRGVEVDLAEERGKPKAAPSASGPPFSFVYIPADVHSAVASLEAPQTVGADVLPTLLAPSFSTDEAMDPETVVRETAGRVKNMMIGGNGAEQLRAPTAQTIQKMAMGGTCESYPLAQPTADNGWCAVRLYIDEVGALRKRPRNQRAEDLLEMAGQPGVKISGDAYVGRVSNANGNGGYPERNISFGVGEMAAGSEWAQTARADHHRKVQEAGHVEGENLKGGEGANHSWTQTDDDVEIRIKGAPQGKGAGKRVSVTYPKGEGLIVKVDSVQVAGFAKLFTNVVPDGCAWTLDGEEIVVTLEKAEQNMPWMELTLPGY